MEPAGVAFLLQMSASSAFFIPDNDDEGGELIRRRTKDALAVLVKAVADWVEKQKEK